MRGVRGKVHMALRVETSAGQVVGTNCLSCLGLEALSSSVPDVAGIGSSQSVLSVRVLTVTNHVDLCCCVLLCLPWQVCSPGAGYDSVTPVSHPYLQSVPAV